MELPVAALEHRYCLLTTRARNRAHTAELWFVPAPGGVFLMSGSGGLTTWCLALQAEEEGVLRIGTGAWQVRAAFLPQDALERTAALEAFHDRYDPPDRDRRGPWLRDAAVAHLVLVRDLA